MILVFPDLDTLRLAVTSKDVVPPDVTLAPAAVSHGEQGWIYVEPTVSLSRAVAKNLDRLGVKGSKRHATDTPREVSSWLELFPLTRETGTPQLSSQASVLFELASADDLPTLVGEMLRLGNDRQSFRFFADPADGDARRVLLRVIGPPYYTLLRALDKSAAGTAGGVRAYLEKAPRVWVEIGHAHPFAPQIRPAERQFVLIRAPRDWLFLDEAPFQDVYDVLQFKLPAGPVGWAEAKAGKKMTVPLRLTAGNAADVPELWVLRENAVEQLDTLVRDADDRLTQRLMFAVATDAQGKKAVVLRTRPSKLAPPVLPLENALGFKPYWKLPNLFVPVGRRLHPTLRREAVRKLLADDPDQVVWLYPDDKGGFTPETVPDAAFRSLEDWVDYVITAEQKPLAAWIEATRFDFDHFVCRDTGGPKPRPGPGDREPRGRDDADDVKAPKPPTAAGKPAARGGKAPAKAGGPADFATPTESRPVDEWKARIRELEGEFMAVEGPLDAPERKALWPELAKANSGAKDATEAAVCWLNALWDADPPPAEWLAGWAGSEAGNAATMTEADFDKRLRSTTASVSEARAVVAGFLWLANQQPIPAWLRPRLPAVQKYVEAQASSLPVRAVWLAAYRLAQLGGGDVLGLARVRDRLLQRLLEHGLQPERDLPIFLRTAGLHDSERMRVVRGKSLELHQAVRKWTDHIPVNRPYVDLLFAFAFGRLGESAQAEKLLDEARQVMERPIPASWDNKTFDQVVSSIASNFLYTGFRFRVENVLAGKPHAGQLPPKLIDELDALDKKGATGPTNNPYMRAAYIIGRMRQQSRILEPHENPDPYAVYTRTADALKKEIADLPTIRDPNKLVDRVRRLFRDGVPGKSPSEVHFFLLHAAIPLSARVGEAFSLELLKLVPAALGGPQRGAVAGPPEIPQQQGQLLERALFLAAHFDRADLIRQLVRGFGDLMRSKSERDRLTLINVVAGQCLRSLRKLGMKDQIDEFLGSIQAEVSKGASLPELRKRSTSRPDPNWGSVLQTLVNLAGGWLTFGLKDHATPILDEARRELLQPPGPPLGTIEYTALARAYVSALGHGPAESGLPRMLELFRRMEPDRITNTTTTNTCYSRFHLNLVEDVILAVVSDEFALGPAGRRWLDDDEYLVRKRIHADMRRNLTGSGL